MRTIRVFLLIIFLNSAITLADEGTATKSALDFINSIDLPGDRAPKLPLNAADPGILRRHFERDFGVQLNKPGSQWHPLVQQTDTYLNEIISELIKNNPRQFDFHWIVELRESGEPMAAAEYFGPDNRSNGFDTATYENLRML